MNVFAKFDEIPSMILQDIKETKHYGHTDVKTVGGGGGYKYVYTVCGGIQCGQHIIPTLFLYSESTGLFYSE